MKIKRGELVIYILAGISVSGILLVGAVFPNIFQIAKLFKKDRYHERALDQSLRNLLRKKMVKFSRSTNGWYLELTECGRQVLLGLEIGQKIMKPRKKWDKKWRLLIFDIAEKRKNVRNRVREALIAFGFYRLQDSVWVYPYECEEILELLRIKYRVRYEALYLRVEYLNNEKWLKNHFNLA